MIKAIKVKNLGKKYILSHRQEEKYEELRDIITSKSKKILKKVFNPSAAGRFRSKYEEFWAVRNISFDVEEGEKLGIIGPNGAGKTTILKLLSRITAPSEGKFSIKGRVASLLEVGTGFHPELTGRENIYLNGSILGMRKVEIERRFDEIVDFAGIEKFLDTPVKRYSSGMYVRLAFSVSAHLEPDILMVDEVLSVGDYQFQKKCLGRMEKVNREGRTVIFISHNLTALRSLCNDAILLEKGKLVARGPVGKIIDKYTNELKKNIFYRDWDDEKTAPGNDSAIIRMVRITDRNGNEIDEIYTNTDFYVEISFKTKSDKSFVGLTIILKDSENNIVFSSINNHEESWYGKPMPSGNYRSVCAVPGNLLNNKFYSLSIILFGKNFSDDRTIDNVISFEVTDSVDVRGDFFGGIGGHVRPLLDWHTEKMD